MDSVADMVDAASRAGVHTMALTEHYPLTERWDLGGFISMPAERVDEYCDAVLAAREAHPEMNVLLGTEVDWLGDNEDRVFHPGEFDRFDLVLGSVHYVDGWAFDDPDHKEHWDDVGVDQIWRRYFEIWCQAAQSDQPFTIMSHPDLVKKFGYRPDYDVQPLYDDAADAARSAGRMVEVNTSGAYYDCEEMFPAPDLLKTFFRAGIPCSIGTDAHRCAHVARGIDAGYRALYDAGYRVVTVPTMGGGRREVPIE